MKPPRCVYCSAPIRKRTRTNWIETKRKPHMTDSTFMRHIVCDEQPADIAACRKLTNELVVSVQRYQGGRIRSFGSWDGVSYVDQFFCNGSHARKFAYALARLGYKLAAPTNTGDRK